VWVWASPAKVVASSGGSVVVILSFGTEALSTSASLLSLNGPHAEAITGRRTGRTLLARGERRAEAQGEGTARPSTRFPTAARRISTNELSSR
jgi:hypothetical protein